MRRWYRVMLILAILGAVVPGTGWYPSVYARTAPRAALLMRISVKPASISLGRDVPLHVLVTDARGRPVDGAALIVSGLSRPAVGTTRRGALTLVVHADRPGRAQVQASRSGYAPARLTIPIVPGSPASIIAFRHGVSVIVPRQKPQPGVVGMDLWAAYQAITGRGQYASLGLRDGTLVYMNSDTDVLITDPLHQKLSKGELFVEVVHGSASHQVQVGTAVAATKGTQLDVKVNPTTKVAQVTVAAGRVQVSATRGSVVVPAGQQTTIPPTGRPTRPRPVNVDALLAWLSNTPRNGRNVPVPTLTLPPPRIARVPAPVPAASPVITVTGTATTTTWSGGPYLVQGHLDVPTGRTLTIAPGTVLEMDPGAWWSVEGTLLAQGTASAPVVFTSSQAQPKPGDWNGIEFDGITSRASVLDHVQVFYAGGGGSPGYAIETVYNGTDPTISNCAIVQSGGIGIDVGDSTHPTITGCVFGGNVGAPASLPPDAVALFTGNGLGAGSLGVQIRAGSPTQRNTTWAVGDVPLVVQGRLDVPAGTTLTIAPGTVLEMDIGVYWTVEGTLLARGTASSPIVFTSSQAQPKPGDWDGIQFSGEASRGSVLDHVQVFYAGGGSNGFGVETYYNATDPTISNSTIVQSGGFGIYVGDGTRPTITGCVFGDNVGAPASLPPDAVALFTGNGFGAGSLGVQVRGGSLTQRSATWTLPDVPLVVQSHLDVPAGTTLTIAPGAVLEMDPSQYVSVEGTLLVQGTASAPVVFTSSQAQPKPGDWDGIQFSGIASRASVLDHVQVFYAGGGGSPGYGVETFYNGTDPTISNCAIAQSSGVGIYVGDGTRPTITGCVFFGDRSAAISLPTQDLQYLHDNAFAQGQQGIQARG